VSSLLHGVIHVILDDPRRPRSPIRKHGVGRDIDVDLAVLQAVLLIEPPIVLGNLILVASLHKDVPQQQRKALMVQTPLAQSAVLKGAVRVISHLRQDFWKIRIYDEEILQLDSKAIRKITKAGIRTR
jgi:hypothetical protein